MIREFIAQDLDRIELGKFGDSELLRRVAPVLSLYEGWTLEKDGVIRAILYNDLGERVY